MMRHNSLTLNAGRHLTPADGSCLMELVSACAGEAWSDHPSCTHPLLAHVARRVNDAMSAGRRPSLIPFIGPLTGATNPDARTHARIALACTELASARRPSLLLNVLTGAAARRSTSDASPRGHRLYNGGTAFRSVDLAVFAVADLSQDVADDTLQMMLAYSLDAVKENAPERGGPRQLPQTVARVESPANRVER